ncbi:MAG: restriction endonuclease [Chloroflexota bacterium]
MQFIHLVEYQPTSFPADRFSTSEVQQLWEKYASVLHIDPPTFQNNFSWVLTPQGWVGHIPIKNKTVLVLESRVPVLNLFEMLRLVYKLPSFKFIDGLTQIQTVEGLLELLAIELASRVLNRRRQGIYQEYIEKREAVGVLRGRIDSSWLASNPASNKIQCDFVEQTADLPLNQVLAYTLRQIALADVCSPNNLRVVNSAWRQLPVSMHPFKSDDLESWTYSRLNADYQPMHALCKFFLDILQPTHTQSESGSDMLPFLVNMPALYEKYVAAWLGNNLPDGYTFQVQERLELDASRKRYVELDLVIYDEEHKPRIVLDTKYKVGEPTNDDIYQVTFYAREIGCQLAGLVYPAPPTKSLSGRNNDIAYAAYTFSLRDEPEIAGPLFLHQLGL